jgi:hypothetical protein
MTFGDRRGYSHLKEEALDRIKWRNRIGRGCGPVVWQITDDDDDDDDDDDELRSVFQRVVMQTSSCTCYSENWNQALSLHFRSVGSISPARTPWRFRYTRVSFAWQSTAESVWTVFTAVLLHFVLVTQIGQVAVQVNWQVALHSWLSTSQVKHRLRLAFLGASAMQRKATVSFVLSVRPSVRM